MGLNNQKQIPSDNWQLVSGDALETARAALRRLQLRAHEATPGPPPSKPGQMPSFRRYGRIVIPTLFTRGRWAKFAAEIWAEIDVFDHYISDEFDHHYLWGESEHFEVVDEMGATFYYYMIDLLSTRDGELYYGFHRYIPVDV